MNLPRELGGQNRPMMLYMMQTELFTRADASVTTHYSFMVASPWHFYSFSIREGTTEFDEETGTILNTRFAEAIDEIQQGNLGLHGHHQPDAGSDMARLRCTAPSVQMANGAYRDKRSSSLQDTGSIILSLPEQKRWRTRTTRPLD